MTILPSQSLTEVLEKSKEIRVRVSDDINTQRKNASDRREEQVKLSQDERSKFNFLAFAIVASVLGISPDSLQNPLVISGLGIVLFNSLLFGFIADCMQRNHNIKNCGEGIDLITGTVEPYYEAYDRMTSYLDEPDATNNGFQKKFDEMQKTYMEYLENSKKAKKPQLAKKTKLAIGYWYFVLFTIGLLILGIGLI